MKKVYLAILASVIALSAVLGTVTNPILNAEQANEKNMMIGNANGDAKGIDITDLVELYDNFGKSNLLADLNADGTVDETDLALLRKELLDGSTYSGNYTWADVSASTSESSDLAGKTESLKSAFAELVKYDLSDSGKTWQGSGSNSSDEISLTDALPDIFGKYTASFANRTFTTGSWNSIYIEKSSFDKNAEYSFYIYSTVDAEDIYVVLNNNSTAVSEQQMLSLKANAWTKVTVADSILNCTATFNRLAIAVGRKDITQFVVTPVIASSSYDTSALPENAIELYELALELINSGEYANTDKLVSAVNSLEKDSEFISLYTEKLLTDLNNSFATLETAEDSGAKFASTGGAITAADADADFVSNNSTKLGTNPLCFDLASGRGIWPILKTSEGGDQNAFYNSQICLNKGEPQYPDAMFYLYTGNVTAGGNFKIEYLSGTNTVDYTAEITLDSSRSNQWIRLSLKELYNNADDITALSGIVRIRLAKDTTLAANGMYISNLLLKTGSENAGAYTDADEAVIAADAKIKAGGYVNIQYVKDARDALVNWQSKQIDENHPVQMVSVKKGTPIDTAYQDKYAVSFTGRLLKTYGESDVTEYGMYIVAKGTYDADSSAWMSKAEKIAVGTSVDADYAAFEVSITNLSNSFGNKGYVAIAYAVYGGNTEVTAVSELIYA